MSINNIHCKVKRRKITVGFEYRLFQKSLISPTHQDVRDIEFIEMRQYRLSRVISRGVSRDAESPEESKGFDPNFFNWYVWTDTKDEIGGTWPHRG